MSERAERWFADDVTGGRLLAAHFARIDVYRRIHEQGVTLGAADMRILWLFADGGSRTLKQVAEELKLEQSTVNRQVNAALAAGYLERTRPKGHAYEFTRTDTGLAVFERNVAITLGAYDQALASMGDDGATFLSLFGRFLDAYGAAVEEAVGDEARS